MILACPNCGWEDVNLKGTNYVLGEEDAVDKSQEGYLNSKLWCFHCMWQGTVGVRVNVLTVKEGRKQ